MFTGCCFSLLSTRYQTHSGNYLTSFFPTTLEDRHWEKTKAYRDSHLLRDAWPMTAGIYMEVDLSLPSPLFLWGAWHQEAQTPTRV